MATNAGRRNLIKGLAFGAIVGAVAAVVGTMSDKDKKVHGMTKNASVIAKKVSAHAMKLGKFSKSAYEKIVDTTIAEYKGAKALTENELEELKGELKERWVEVQKVFEAKK